MGFKISIWLLLASFTSLSIAVPSPQQPSVTSAIPPAIPNISTITSIPPLTTTTPIPDEPCATLSAYRARSALSSLVPADIAWKCMQSVPLNATQAIPWLESLKPYIQWQTTLEYAANPPKSWPFPSDDVLGRLDAIIGNVTSYPNQYALEFDVFQTIHQVFDGHFSYTPLMIGSIATFGRPVSLVSISRDGKELPKPYVYADILSVANGTSFEPSAVNKINGQNVTVYLQAVGVFGTEQNLQAQYNRVFATLAQLSLGSLSNGGGYFSGGGRGAYFYPGADTTLTFENGTSRTYQNFARVVPYSLTNVTTGLDIYNKFINPDRYNITTTATTSTVTTSSTRTSTSTTSTITTTSRASTSSSSTRTTSTSTYVTPPPAGYPTPVIRAYGNTIAGYYLQGSGYEDVAVLGVSSFSPSLSYLEYQAVAYNFFNQAVAAGKTKLVIDVSANGGGSIAESYNLFTNLMPEIVPYGGSRYRDHEAFDIIGQSYSKLSANTSNYISLTQQLFAYQFWRDRDLKNFSSYSDYYGPDQYDGGNFTRTLRWNLDPVFSGINVTGYGNRTGLVKSRPFQVEDIVLLTDGFCASACALFSEFMTHQAGVKTVVLGGLPRPGPMQAVGATKGSQVLSWSILRGLALSLLVDRRFDTTQRQQWSMGILGKYNNSLPFYRATGSDGTVNLRSATRQNGTQIPLQYTYEAADCRIYYRQSHTIDVTTMWKDVADVAWGSGTCAYGSIQSSSTKRDQTRRSFNHVVRREAVHPHELARLEAAQFVETDPLAEPRNDMLPHAF